MTELLNIVIPPLAQTLTYGLPSEIETVVEIGHRVTVPLGSRSATGFVIGKQPRESASSEYEIRSITSSYGETPCFLESQLEFFQWVADYYGDTLSNVIDVGVPPMAIAKFRRSISLAKIDSSDIKGKLQREIILFLQENPTPVDFADLTRRFKNSSSALKTLSEKGIITIESEELLDHHLHGNTLPDWAKKEVTLNDVQRTAVEEISKCARTNTFHSFLLHGATGSGKTEIYIEAIKNVLAEGKGAIVIVPEIALTPQLIDRFRARLGNSIGVLHSGLHKRVRWDSWRALIEGRNHVAIGARSGIFAPVLNLGLIIVDEEHDSSYKQSDGLRYNARDLALVRGKLDGCPVVLGSATPSLETFHAALTKRYSYISLPQRFSTAPPLDIEIVDMNALKPWEMASKNVSPILRDALNNVLENKEQAFILYNRRGFANYLQCPKCEHVIKCPNCSVTFTYHRSSNSLVCHYCNLHVIPSEFCPQCATTKEKGEPGKLEQRGAGTERVFEELSELFPEAKIDRLDRDVVDSIDTYSELLNKVRSGETQILVGTQMIAKGHDLPGVTLVGVVDCDVGLHMPDFRAAEKVFQLLTQASGRAGRGDKMGRVILQTRVPQHPSLVATQEKNFTKFAKLELQARQQLNYPPFSRLLRIVASSQDESIPEMMLKSLSEFARRYLETQHLQATVLGPAPAPLEKLKTEWRWHLLIKSQSATTLNQIMTVMKKVRGQSRKVKVTFDMDPHDML